jgi:uncharacterized protein YpmS
MEIFIKIWKWLPYILAGFILFAIAVRIIAKISIKTWFEEKFKIEKENKNGKNYSRTKKSRTQTKN